MPLVDEREDREQPLACERVGVLQSTHEGAYKGGVAELGHDATEGAVDGGRAVEDLVRVRDRVRVRMG